MRKILIVEDDTLLNKTLAYNLASEGYETYRPLPTPQPWHICKRMNLTWCCWTSTCRTAAALTFARKSEGRGQHSYIMFLTASDKESDMLGGYEAGGADYVTKPFSVAGAVQESWARSLPTWSGANPTARPVRRRLPENRLLRADGRPLSGK